MLFHRVLISGAAAVALAACGSSAKQTSSSESTGSGGGATSVASSSAASSSSSQSSSSSSSSGGGAGGEAGAGIFKRTGGTFSAFPFVGKVGAVQPSFGSEVSIADRDIPGFCGDLFARQNTTLLYFRLANYHEALAPRTFKETDLDQDGDFYGWLVQGGSDCKGTQIITAKGSTVTLASVGATVEGSLDWTLADGTTLSGTFSIPVCTTPATGAACMP